MQLLTTAPATADALGAMYRRTPSDGMVFSGLVHKERFAIAENYDDDLSCAAITWSAGGEEGYRLQRGDAIMVRSAGALTLARGARYAYAAYGEAPFRSNMISFPHWISGGANAAMLDEGETPRTTERKLETKLQRPAPAAQVLMDAIAGRCRTSAGHHNWYAEQCAQLYEVLLDAQDGRAAAQAQLDAVKPSTRAELARRAGLAKTCMLQRFGESGLSLNQIAREACLSPYHLIRVFRAMTGATPMQFLAAIRMDAAQRLLKETALPVTEIAARAGYSDRTAFFKAFRKHFGCAPSAVERPFA